MYSGFIDTIAISAIMEKFLEEPWKKDILERFSFSFIPILNPDGFANSMQGSNANSINFHWRFFGNTKEKCPEAYHIWEYCIKLKPVVFFDFHAFTFQNNRPRPYIIPEGYYVTKKSRRIQKYFNANLLKLCGLNDCNYSRNEVILAPNLLSSKLRDELGTLTVPKFHLHMNQGLDASKNMAIDSINIIIQGLRKFNVKNNGEILKSPYGKIETKLYDKLRIKLLNFWFFNILVILKKIILKFRR